VIEAAFASHRNIERTLPGMTERRMTEVVGERQRLGEIFVDAKRARHRARDLRDFEAVREARPVMVAFMIDEDLGLVGKPPEGGGMQNPVAVALEGGAGRAWRLGHEAAPRAARLGRVRGKTAGVLRRRRLFNSLRLRPRVD